jgi:hypothetical protein
MVYQILCHALKKEMGLAQNQGHWYSMGHMCVALLWALPTQYSSHNFLMLNHILCHLVSCSESRELSFEV